MTASVAVSQLVACPVAATRRRAAHTPARRTALAAAPQRVQLRARYTHATVLQRNAPTVRRGASLRVSCAAPAEAVKAAVSVSPRPPASSPCAQHSPADVDAALPCRTCSRGLSRGWRMR
jgi:hypothetical protein